MQTGTFMMVPGLGEAIPANWQGKLILASELGINLGTLRYKGSDETLLEAYSGPELIRLMREELTRRRER
jgi:hypothetical protein